jgi:hypothetical protein
VFKSKRPVYKLINVISNASKTVTYVLTVAFCIGCSQAPNDEEKQASAEKSVAEKKAVNKEDGLFSAQREALDQAKLMKEKVEAEQKKQAEALKKIKDGQ